MDRDIPLREKKRFRRPSIRYVEVDFTVVPRALWDGQSWKHGGEQS